MLQSIFDSLTHAAEGTLWMALAASPAWGLLSIVLSHCHLASIPLIVAFIDKQGLIFIKRAFLISLLFAVGILATIVAIRLIAALAGRRLGNLGPYVNQAVAVIFLLVGLYLMDVVSHPLPGTGAVTTRQKGLLAAFVLGILFGGALGPCTFAYTPPMLAASFKVVTSNMAYGVLLLTAFGIGHCAVIVLAGTSAESLQHYLNRNQNSRGPLVLKT